MPGEHFVIKQRGNGQRVPLSFVVSVVLAACGGAAGTSSPAAPGPVTSARGAGEQFMEAVAESNGQKMARLLGTSAGPPGNTNQPPARGARPPGVRAHLPKEGTAI